MKISLDDSRVELRPRQILRLDSAKSVRIVCQRGALWVTQNEDLRDVFLSAGASFTLDRDGVALVSALEASSVRLEEPVRLRSQLRNAAEAVWRGLAQRLRVPSHNPAIELRGY